MTPAQRLKEALTTQGVNMAVPWVLMASYLYYHRDTTILTDQQFDGLTKLVRAKWSEITHFHKDLLACLLEQDHSSLHHIPEAAYPQRCRSAACRLAEIPMRDPPAGTRYRTLR